MIPAAIRGLVELTRPVNAVAAGALTAIGAYVAGGVTGAPTAVGFAVGATVMATAAGNAINDYFDREIDRVNRPDRPIPRGAVPPQRALWFGLGLFGAAVALALFLPPLAIAIAGINLLLLLTYTTVFKGRPGVGNLVVGVLSGSTFLFGGAAVGRVGPAGVLFVLAALATVSREILKDVEDVAGDRREGLVTLPIAIGSRPASWIALTILVIALLASPVPFLRNEFGWPYLFVLVPANAMMLAAAIMGFRDPRRGQTWLKYGMFLAAAAFVVGRATVS